MRKFLRTILVVGTAVAAILGLTGAPANADVGWTVTPSGPFPGVSTNFRMTNKGTTLLQCGRTTFSSSVASSTTNTIGHITAITWSNCAGPIGTVFTVRQMGTWSIEAHAANADGVTGVIRINLGLSRTLCSASVTGTARWSYDNAGTLVINEPEGGNLVVSGASCFDGTLRNGDRPGLFGTFATPPTVITPA
ncbi:hypothetical protein [Thermomonospora cellulosilytica]|uniref:Uncharacterized protein n=1 Tax=Thermomonospora cellulosilytica TaxID=1411118 RepID=A0A7W3MYQ5_9ACTN|nr:hypothetical protein [Thermomonospora cellulosilytica]MBA9004301.1 hypothetical protein [Thermomonospora cellulosilytica]